MAELLSDHPEVARTREARLVWRYGNDGRSDELEPKHASASVIESIHESFGRAMQPASGRLVEKTPANSVRPWFVNEVFPDAVFVHIMRNGWTCVPAIRAFWEDRSSGVDAKQLRKARRRLREARLSQLPHYGREFAGRIFGGSDRARLYGPRVVGLREAVTEHGVLEAAALQWQRCVERSATFGRSVGSQRYMELRLEEFGPDQLTELLAFCGLAASPTVTDEHRRRYDSSTARRQRPLSPDDVRRIEPVIVPLNSWLGYPLRPGGC